MVFCHKEINMSETIETTTTNNNAPIAAPDPMSEDYESILGNDNASTFNRYAIPPQFDGNSSEEDNQDSETLKEEKAEENEDVNVEEELETGYEPLVEDEFGEFVSSENFGDYYTPDAVGTLRASVERNTLETTESEIKDDTIIESVPSNTTNEKERVSIAPLDADKIQLIKAAMAKVSIKPPNMSAMVLADTLERRKIRVGDEITE